MLVVTLVAAIAPRVAEADPTLAGARTIAGPAAGIKSLDGMSIARDGTGGLVFTEQAGGVDHVFVSRLLSGDFQPPVEVDASLASDSSQPVIAAGNGGVLLVAFINGGSLYTADASGASADLGPPQGLYPGAVNPSISISNYGKAYLAFAATGPGGHDIHVAYYDARSWSIVTGALDANPADDAGSGTGRPAVTTSGDGVGIAAWGEGGHIYTRRIRGTSPSIVALRADPPTLGGLNEVAAGNPTISTGGDSSYADVGYQEALAGGGLLQVRSLMSRLVAGSYQGPVGADSLRTPGTDSGLQAKVTENEYGRGYVTASEMQAHELFALELGTNGAARGIVRVDSQGNTAAPDATSAAAGLSSNLIAWQQTPAVGLAEIHLRYAGDGTTMGAELVASTPALGGTDGALGLSAGGTGSGDAAVAWVQGPAGARTIDVAQLYQPPGPFAAAVPTSYVNTTRPTFTWSPARDQWGPDTYYVSLNGVVIATTTATSLQVPSALPSGRYTWQLTAVGHSGLTSTASPATVTVDTTAPIARVALSGKRVAGGPLHLSLTDSDRRPGLPAEQVSGVAAASVNWGDRTTTALTTGKYHKYARAGLFKLTVTITDRAGNATRIVRYVRVLPARKQKRRHA